MKKFSFYKEGGKWYIKLPNFPKEELEMKMGSDIYLEYLGKKTKKVELYITTEFTKTFDVLNFYCTCCDGGALYAFNSEMNDLIWIPDVAKKVFGMFPDKIYTGRVFQEEK